MKNINQSKIDIKEYRKFLKKLSFEEINNVTYYSKSIFLCLCQQKIENFLKYCQYFYH